MSLRSVPLKDTSDRELTLRLAALTGKYVKRQVVMARSEARMRALTAEMARRLIAPRPLSNAPLH